MSLEQYLKPVTGQRANICWDCGRNIAECPWLHEGKPVEGWTARKVTRKFGAYEPGPGRRLKWQQTYSVTACPLYEKPRRGLK